MSSTGLSERLSRGARFLYIAMLLLVGAGCAGPRVSDMPAPSGGKYPTLELEVYQETNRLRSDPPAYAAVLRSIESRISDGIYYPVNTEVGVRMREGKAVVNEAITALSDKAPRTQLTWSDALAAAARAHVQDIGPKGMVSHESSSGQTMSERLKPVMEREGFTAVAENIAFGYDLGQDVVAQLFIDDGVPGRGHRKNLLKKKLNYTGVGCGPHKHYRYMCVAIYAFRDE